MQSRAGTLHFTYYVSPFIQTVISGEFSGESIFSPIGKYESNYKEVQVGKLTFSKQGSNSDVSGSSMTPKFISRL